MKFLNNTSRYKILTGFLIFTAVLIPVYILFLAPNELDSVDKIVIQTMKKETTITDQTLIKKIVDATRTAETYGHKVVYRNYIRLYHGDKLVKEMRQGLGGKAFVVEVKRADDYPESGDEVYLSLELLAEIEAALAADDNAYTAE